MAEGDEANNGDDEGGTRKPRFSRKMLIVIGAAAVVVLGGGAAAFMMMGRTNGPAEATVVQLQTDEPTAYYYDMPVMILNLSASENRAAYVKLAVSLEVSDESMLELIKPNMPRVLDAFQTYMRELRTSDLEGSAGLYRLKEELQRRINIAVYPARVDDVLFKNVIVQ
jgi:flagellar protein FliL